MQPSTYNLFVYGSLRKGFQHPAYQYISTFFKLVGAGKVRGILYDMGEFPAAIPVHSDNFIVGELYTLNNPDEFGWAIGQIDDYEGINVEFGEIPLYRRDITTVFVNGQTTPAWIYWYAGDITGSPVIESGDVLQYVQEKNRL
ncbi:MAG: gamma-glutamylcyclotransferase [Chitinophagaceae bacterium]|nr:gamma-glutamylcyclotransferase [Chitinophagaceae bacterium]